MSNRRTIMYNELEMIRKKVFLAYFKVLSWHVTAQTEEYQSAQPALHQNSNWYLQKMKQEN
jgi:hypothetical protein